MNFKMLGAVVRSAGSWRRADDRCSQIGACVARIRCGNRQGLRCVSPRIRPAAVPAMPSVKHSPRTATSCRRRSKTASIIDCKVPCALRLRRGRNGAVSDSRAHASVAGHKQREAAKAAPDGRAQGGTDEAVGRRDDLQIVARKLPDIAPADEPPLLLSTRLALIGGVAAGLLFSGAYLGGASAQPRTAVDSGADLQTLYATPEDIAQGKLLAEQTCAGCHGANGVSQTPAIPHLAGQRSAYLFNELKGIQAGARGETPMNVQVKFLSDDALLKVSAYFASLDPPQAVAANAASAAVDPVQAGKTAAAACAGCHGESGVSTTPGMPSLAGLDPKYTAAAMKAYKSGQRESELMKSMLASVADPGHRQYRALLCAAKAGEKRRLRPPATRRRVRRPPRAARDAMDPTA